MSLDHGLVPPHDGKSGISGYIARSKRADWEQYNISQCITLSLANIDRNESMLVAASYLWSDALNAFLFDHGRMTPTLEM